MKVEEINHFENEDGLFKNFGYFLKTMVEGKEGFITADNFDLYLDWTN